MLHLLTVCLSIPKLMCLNIFVVIETTALECCALPPYLTKQLYCSEQGLLPFCLSFLSFPVSSSLSLPSSFFQSFASGARTPFTLLCMYFYWRNNLGLFFNGKIKIEKEFYIVVNLPYQHKNCLLFTSWKKHLNFMGMVLFHKTMSHVFN